MQISIKQLKIHLDERGYLFETLRFDDSQYIQYGQTYINITNSGVVKGFHLHKQNIDNITCIQGQIKLVLIDQNNNIHEYFMGIENPIMVTIPSNIWHGWKCISTIPAIIINSSSLPFNKNNPDELKQDPHNNQWRYSWERIDK
jgi:dTDP-4-dehydrorhamnose 3,5-epimerase